MGKNLDSVQIGINILFYLKKQNRTQVDLANELGVSKQVINKITRGRKELKTIELVAISECLGIESDQLINECNIIDGDEIDLKQLYDKIKNRENVDFLIALINNLTSMDEEMSAYVRH